MVNFIKLLVAREIVFQLFSTRSSFSRLKVDGPKITSLRTETLFEVPVFFVSRIRSNVQIQAVALGFPQP